MVCLGVQNVTCKNGSQRSIISCVGHRLTGSIFVDKIWVDPKEIERNNLMPGDQFRAFKDGGIMKLEGCTVDVSFLSDIL